MHGDAGYVYTVVLLTLHFKVILWADVAPFVRCPLTPRSNE